MPLYRLNKKIEIWRPSAQPNDFDGGHPSPEFVGVAWAEVGHLSARDSVEVQQVYAGATVRAVIRQSDVKITAGMVARINDVDHPIRGVTGLDDGEQYRQLLLEVPPEHVGMSYR